MKSLNQLALFLFDFVLLYTSSDFVVFSDGFCYLLALQEDMMQSNNI